jgi:hypothetical protein
MKDLAIRLLKAATAVSLVAASLGSECFIIGGG